VSRFRLLNKGRLGDKHGGALGIDMQDGTQYRPSDTRAPGTVEVDRPDHVKAIKRSAAYNHYDGIKEVSYAMATEVTVRCPLCFFAPWREQPGDPCPRCGTPLQEEN